MSPSTRIIVNTIAQYCRSVITMALAFVTTRVVFRGLGVVDYGIFSVVAGLVAMLGFITNALVITTQRYISYSRGIGEKSEIHRIFINSLLIHFSIAIVLTLALMLFKDTFVAHWLNIPRERVDVAGTVYEIMAVLLALTILEAPFRALFVARENIVFISLVEIIDAVVKLTMVVLSFKIAGIDKLIAYSNVMALVMLINFIVFAGYAALRYEECTLKIRRGDINKKYLLGLTNFAGWTTVDTASAVLRSQGIAVIMNYFLGAVINASFGIALQIKTASGFILTSVLNAMTPQIMKAEGAGARKRMLRLSALMSKYSTSLMILSVFPTLFELPSLLTLWLGSEPEHASMFCTFLIVAFLIDGASLGLHVANQAVGKIGKYTLVMNTPKILSLVLVWLVLKWNYSVVSVMWIYLIVETLVSFYRIPFTARRAGLSKLDYVRQVVIPLVLLSATITVSCELIIHLFDFHLRFILTYVTAVITGTVVMWKFLLEEREKLFIKEIMHRIIGRANRD